MAELAGEADLAAAVAAVPATVPSASAQQARRYEVTWLRPVPENLYYMYLPSAFFCRDFVLFEEGGGDGLHSPGAGVGSSDYQRELAELLIAQHGTIPAWATTNPPPGAPLPPLRLADTAARKYTNMFRVGICNCLIQTLNF